MPISKLSAPQPHELVSKVNELVDAVNSGGGGGAPSGDGRTDLYSLTDSQSNGSYTGLSVNLVIKDTFWLQSIIFKPVGDIVDGTINLRTYSGFILQTIRNVNIVANQVGSIPLNEPILLNNGMLFRIEILYNASMKHYRNSTAGDLYDGVLWKSEGINVDTWTGKAYLSQVYIGLVEFQ